MRKKIPFVSRCVRPACWLFATLSFFAMSPAVAQLLTPPSGIPFSQSTIDASNPRNPNCKAIGDIDGDGFLDVLASSNIYTEGLYWYKYPAWTKYRIATGSFTTDMQTADVDGDGDLDVVIPKNGSAVTWYENPRPAGNPGVDQWSEHLIGFASTHDISTGDLDNDGRLDVGVRLNTTTIFFRNADLSWTSLILNTPGGEGLAFGDIDGDGDLDIAAGGTWLENPLPSGNPRTVAWVQRQFAAGWVPHTTVQIFDINSDGRKDIFLSPSESANGKISWFESATPRTGPWTEHVVATGVSYVHEFHLADFDNDGDRDIAFAEMHQSSLKRVGLFLNNGGGLSWTEQDIATTGSHDIRVGDFGNDGDIDIIGANWDDGNTFGAPILFWENRLNNPVLTLDSWQRNVVDASRPWQSMFVAAADIDRDGKKDIITGAWWYRNPGTASGTWIRNTIGSPLNNMASVFDFDNDGAADILGTQGVGSSSNSQFVWARNNGTGSFTILNNIPNGTGEFLQGVETRRFANIASEAYKVALSWHAGGVGIQMLTVPENPSTGSWGLSLASSTTQGEQVSGKDIDNDGYIDLMLGTKWLRNNSGSGWSPYTLSNNTGHPDRNRVADISRDGKPDVVVGYEAINLPGRLAWYEQPSTPTGLWTEHVISDVVVGPMSVDLADMDRDGDLDVIVGEHNYATPSTARLLIFENVDGYGNSWTIHTVFTGDEHHDGAQVVDIDNDGDLDIISIGWQNYKTILYENRAITEGGGIFPAIISHPSDRTVVEGQTATFTVVATGTAPLDYQWLKNNVPLRNAVSATYVTPPTTLADNNTNFRCVVTNIYGSVTSNQAILTVASVGSPPTITSHPANKTVTLGQTATFSVTASSTQPMTYQWLKNGSNISGATSASYTTPVVVAGDNGATFRCSVSNIYGSTLSNNATLTVIPPNTFRVTRGLQALYNFEEGSGSVVNDVSGAGTPLNLTVADPSNVTWGPGYLSVNTSTIISTPILATKIYNACRLTDEITIEAWVRPANTTQNGPARIVTLSSDALNRDFTLGQGVAGGASNAYDLRRRTSTTSSNGTPSLSTTAGSLSAQLTHVVATRSASGINKIFINGVETATGSVEGSFSNWENYKLAFANELTNDRPWLGEFHLVAIYNRALTTSEINQNYSAGPFGQWGIFGNLKLMMQGPFDAGGDTMRAAIQNVLPFTQPFNVPPWTYAGQENVSSIPNGVVDWVLIELRTGTAAGTKVAARAGFLRTNGIVVDVDGGQLKFQNILDGNYYVVIRHRNHLSVMSASAASLSQASDLYDFSAGTQNAYGSQPLVKLSGIVYGFYGGDADASGLVTSQDANLVLPNFNRLGYNAGDLNLSGIVSTSDLKIIFDNLNRATQVPP